MTADDVRAMLKDATEKRGKKRWAGEAGVTPNYVSAVLSGKTEPGPSICRALGICRTAVYEIAEPT